MMPLKKIVFLLAVFFSMQMNNAFAQQQTADIGLFGGGNIPITDYDQMNLLQSVYPAFSLFYRYNFNSRFALRINATYGTTGASGVFNSAPVSFQKNIMGLGAFIEVNYLDFLLGVEKMKFSPYVYTGVGFMYFPTATGAYSFSPNLPIGLGVKYALFKQFGIGADVSFRKTFSDDIDNLNNPHQQYGLTDVNDIFHNNDWIVYFGLTLNYKFYLGKKPCPAYESKY
ncbi:MAG: hypothetical protein JW798_12515 [Prolixibacteraceae bacterium]|nr:hypothetical protein [Prolixibacteraceae bacterium]